EETLLLRWWNAPADPHRRPLRNCTTSQSPGTPRRAPRDTASTASMSCVEAGSGTQDVGGFFVPRPGVTTWRSVPNDSQLERAARRPPRGRLGAESSHDAGTGYSLCRRASRALPCLYHAPPARHTPDDPTEYSVSRDGVPDGLSAPARSRPRPRADTSRRLAHVILATLFRPARRPRGRCSRPARADRRKAWPAAAVDRSLS